MKLAPGSHSWARSQHFGAYFESLLNNDDWVLRRVETIHLLDIERIERRVSLDIDLAGIREKAKPAGLGVSRLRTILVPLAQFAKGLQLDLDVRASGGDVIQVLTSDQDSRASQAALLRRVADAQEGGEDLLSELPASVIEDIFMIAKEETFSRYLEVLEGLRSDQKPDQLDGEGSIDDATQKANVDGWRRLQGIESFDDWLLNLAASYLLVARVPASGDVTTIKFRYVEASDDWRPSRPARLGLVDPDFGIMISGGFGQRQHVRLVAPSGMEVDTAVLENVWTLSKDDDVSPFRITPERAALYRSGGDQLRTEKAAPKEPPRRSIRLLSSMTPKLGGFHVPALGSVGFTLALVGLALFLELDRRALSKLEDTDAAVTILALVPSILAVYVARADEHPYVSQLLSIPRGAVFLTAVLTVVSAGAVAIDAGRFWLLVLLEFTTGFTAAVLLLIIWISIRVTRKQRRVRSLSGVTQQSGASRDVFLTG
jgi:hypothetical protein